ncbi:MAG: aminoacyl-histidine dipeptidase [Oscillospiraceae bacterium]|nr:aminoacyl-histidine dipeptidase [Oscillospiraceae bacterium]
MPSISNLKPKKVFEFFELISSVPHGSGNTDMISGLCCEFARLRGLRYIQDALGNVIIFKPASAGYEDHEPVVIQGHMDMVTVKTPDSDIDLDREGLCLRTDREYLWADGTSLGADDGIAIAMAMAVLDSDDIPHPPIEAVFTINEETGMDGAEFIDTSVLSGRRMLNIDSEAEGVITAGCAGGIRVFVRFAMNRSTRTLHGLRLSLNGLIGGHSGSEIHHNRANSNILMAQLLHGLQKTVPVSLSSLNGGEKDNAIANAASAVIAFAPEDFSAVSEYLADFKDTVICDISKNEPDVKLAVENLGVGEIDSCDFASSERIISAIYNLPNGVIAMNPYIPGLVQTSTNLGIVSTDENSVKLTFCLRSSVMSELRTLTKRISDTIEAFGGKASTGGAYPAWEYKNASPLRDKAVESYTKLFGKPPKIEVIHAGLECGLFSAKIPELDCISFGPDILDIHTVNEKLSISSAERTYRLLLELLKNL